jgi:hypothetical protein
MNHLFARRRVRRDQCSTPILPASDIHFVPVLQLISAGDDVVGGMPVSGLNFSGERGGRPGLTCVCKNQLTPGVASVSFY